LSLSPTTGGMNLIWCQTLEQQVRLEPCRGGECFEPNKLSRLLGTGFCCSVAACSAPETPMFCSVLLCSVLLWNRRPLEAVSLPVPACQHAVPHLGRAVQTRKGTHFPGLPVGPPPLPQEHQRPPGVFVRCEAAGVRAAAACDRREHLHEQQGHVQHVRAHSSSSSSSRVQRWTAYSSSRVSLAEDLFCWDAGFQELSGDVGEGC
jgi:hypothetical protein